MRWWLILCSVAFGCAAPVGCGDPAAGQAPKAEELPEMPAAAANAEGARIGAATAFPAQPGAPVSNGPGGQLGDPLPPDPMADPGDPMADPPDMPPDPFEPPAPPPEGVQDPPQPGGIGL